MADTTPPQQIFVERRADNRNITLQDVKNVIHTALLEHEIREKDNVVTMIQALKEELVPEGETFQHREYHAKKINAAKAEEDFWVSAKKKVVENGITGLFGILKVLVYLGFISLAFKIGITLPGWLMR